MRLIESKAELIQQREGLDGLYKQIELAGRTCYKSSDKITEDSAKPFVDKIIKSDHLAMCEHGTVYLKLPIDYSSTEYNELENRYETNPYSKIDYDGGIAYITSNYRVLVEHNWLSDLKYLCKPEKYHEKRYTFIITTSIGVSREFNRHRTFSVAEQSTRYCNYSKDKYDNEIKFIRPSWLNINLGKYEYTALGSKPWNNCIAGDGYLRKVDELSEDILFLKNCLNAEQDYMQLINIHKWQPQQAREVLPLCTATEVCYTAFQSDWRHFFDLRFFGTTGRPHPNAEYTARLMLEEARKAGIREFIIN